VNASTEYNFCGGKFTISTQCNPSSLMEENGVLPLIIKELKRFRKGITQKELTISKMKKKDGLLFELDDRNTLSNYNGWSLLYYPPSKIVPYSKIYETFIEKITVSNVNDCIKKYFCLDRMCLVVVGNNIPCTEIMVEECLRL
jgi:predicted Zn-dependent peptidase